MNFIFYNNDNQVNMKIMIILGITGSIGMGKTTVARQFASFGIPVFNADKTAHEILNNSDVVEEIGGLFPAVIDGDIINRAKLGDIVFNSREELAKLEEILHPIIRRKMEEFISANSGEKIILLDIPLLFQTGWDKLCDYTIRVKAPHFIQKIRVMKRPHMTEEKFKHILSQQENHHKTDFTIQTGFGMWYSMRQIKRILNLLQTQNPTYSEG